MKGKTRGLAMILCVLMLATALAACSSAAPTAAPSSAASNPTTAPTVAPTAAPTEAPAAPAEKAKISYSCWGTIEEGKSTQKTLDAFNASQDKVEVELQLIPWEGYVAQLNIFAASNNLPDSANLKEEMVKPWVAQDMLADVSSMYSDADKPLDCITFKSADGKPVAYSVAAETVVMYYNKAMFDTAGVAYPPASVDKAWTWDQFVDAAKKLTLDKNGKHPTDAGFDDQNITQYGALVENLTWQLEWPVLSNGGGFFSADGSKLTIGEPEAIEAIQKVADLYLKDKVAPLSTGATDDGVSRGLIAGTVAMTTNGTWNVGTCLNTAKAAGLNYGIAVLPKMKDYVTIATGGTDVVFKQSKNQAAAIEWIKWKSSIENSWDGLVATGIWPPIFKKYYTDETLTHKWLDNPNFPPYADYKSAVVDTTVSAAAHPTAWMYTQNTANVYPLLSSILGDVWSGKVTAKDAITKNLDKLQAAFEGNK
jgi:multiple sugar transport system substrate-binding protein